MASFIRGVQPTREKVGNTAKGTSPKAREVQEAEHIATNAVDSTPAYWALDKPIGRGTFFAIEDMP